MVYEFEDSSLDKMIADALYSEVWGRLKLGETWDAIGLDFEKVVSTVADIMDVNNDKVLQVWEDNFEQIKDNLERSFMQNTDGTVN